MSPTTRLAASTLCRVEGEGSVDPLPAASVSSRVTEQSSDRPIGAQ